MYSIPTARSRKSDFEYVNSESKLHKINFIVVQKQHHHKGLRMKLKIRWMGNTHVGEPLHAKKKVTNIITLVNGQAKRKN
jgi:hypothetical protein